MRKVWKVLLICLLLLSLAACGASIETEKEKAEKNVEQVFNDAPAKPNKKTDLIEFHLSDDMSVKETTSNNILLEKKDRTYILFYNPNEAADSHALYDNAENSGSKIITNRTFTDDQRFGYLIISEIDENLFEVSAGIGGVKATTESKTKFVAEDAKILMELVSSTKFMNT